MQAATMHVTVTLDLWCLATRRCFAPVEVAPACRGFVQVLLVVQVPLTLLLSITTRRGTWASRAIPSQPQARGTTTISG
jgi:hypothetical protein